MTTVQVKWYNDEKTIVHYIFQPQWTVDDLLEAVHKVNAMLEEIEHDAALLYDVRLTGTYFPASLLLRLRELYEVDTENGSSGIERTPLLCFLGTTPVIDSLMTLYSKTFGVKRTVRFVETLEGALRLMQEEGYLHPEATVSSLTFDMPADFKGDEDDTVVGSTVF